MTALLASGDPFRHTWDTWVLDLYVTKIDLRHVPMFEQLGISKYVLMMLTSALLLILLGAKAGGEARRALAEGRPARGLGAVIEVVFVFIRDQMMAPQMPHHFKHGFLQSFFATLFFFILLTNLVGLLPPPFGSTATGTVWVSGALSFGASFVMILGAGIWEKGLVGFFKGLVPHGVPLVLAPILFGIELVGLFVKPFALMIRLAANMTAGHIILAVLIGFLSASFSNVAVAGMVYGASAAGYLAITVFEIAIALIQAYIFTVLSCVFVGQSLSHEH